MSNHRSLKGHRRRRARMQLDPHYFVGMVRNRTSSAVRAERASRASVRYDITMEEVLADLTYGQD